jgi:hypothetical protein
MEELGHLYRPDAQAPGKIEYRSAGQYVTDYWQARTGVEDARKRIDTFTRAAAHQTTADNPGVIPTPILGPVVNFIDASRPLVSWLGPRQLPSGSWTRPKVTQHTTVAAQSGEKTELVSQKMTIVKLVGTAATYGGYVNVSRQDIDWSQPGVMDIVIGDLAGMYAIATEAACGTAIMAGAASGLAVPTGAATVAALQASLWDAAGKVYAATKGQGNLGMFISADMLAMWGPLFAPVNPTNAVGSGFSAGSVGTGLMGTISGIPVYMTNGLAAGSNLVLSSAAVEVYEDRIGALQVIEPSVLGVQVAYAGYFTQMLVEATGAVKFAKTP